jgi:hypothetical protein
LFGDLGTQTPAARADHLYSRLHYESGARRLDLLELRQICGILGIRLVDLVKKFEKLLQ